MTPDTPKRTDSGYMKQEKRKRFRSRTGIGHLKSDFRMAQNYLHGEAGIRINALMSCAAWNLKKLMAVLNEQAARLFARLFVRPLYLIFGVFSPIKVIRKERLFNSSLCGTSPVPPPLKPKLAVQGYLEFGWQEVFLFWDTNEIIYKNKEKNDLWSA